MENTRGRKEGAYLATQNEILEAARQQMASEGAGSLSLRAIARRMGLTPPALYYYFSSRDQLVTVLIVAAYNSLTAALETAVFSRSAEDAVGRLLAIALTYRAWALAHPQDYALIFGTPIPGYHAPQDVMRPAARRSFDVLVNALAAAAARAEPRQPARAYLAPPAGLLGQIEALRAGYANTISARVLHLALVGWSRLHGLVSLELSGQLPPAITSPDEFFRSEVLVYLESAGFEVEPAPGSRGA